jgi:hypothetical protein
MTKQGDAKGLYPLVILAGEGLVVLGFYFITETTGRGPVAWLNLAVCMLIFFLDASPPLLFARTAAEFSDRIPSIGILWLLRIFYTLASISVILAGWRWGVAFRFQLLVQLAIFLVAGVFVLAAMFAAEHAVDVKNEEGGLLANIDLLRNGMTSLAMQISRLPTLSALAKQANRCSDDARYMTPSRNPRAWELETQLLGKIRETEAFLNNQSSPGTSEDDLRGGAAKLLEEITFLLQDRKACSIE